ncbi:MAG: Ig-like domain-containing protein, partial [bacterium]|nr:Ig-like domain-containing protein [bacterium]
MIRKKSEIPKTSINVPLKNSRNSVKCQKGFSILLMLCLSLVTIKSFSTTITVTNTNTSGTGSFDQAVQDFIAGGTSSTISFDASLSGSTITITQAYSFSANSLVIDGDVNGDGVSDITLQSDGADHGFFSLSGTAAITFENLLVENFSTTGDGGVVQISTGTVTIDNCVIRNNTALSGGVIYITNGFGTGDANISKSIFYGNSATSFGGVIYQASFLSSIHTVIENSLFYENSAPNSNGGVAYISDGSNFTLRHVTMSNNSSKFSGGAISNNNNLTIENSLIVGNTSESEASNIHNNRTFNNVGGSIVGGDNGASDEVSDYFVDAANGDYNLFSTSPAVSAGLNSLATAAGITTDIVGNAVPYDGIVDIVDAGAYEFQGDPPIDFESEAVISSSSMTVTLTFDREVSGLLSTDFSSKTGDLSISSLTTSDNIEYTAIFSLSDLTEKVIDTVYMDALVEDLFMNNLQAKDTFAYIYYVPVAQVTNTQTSGEGSLDQALQDFIDSEGTVNTVEFDPSLIGSTITVTKDYSFSQGTLLIDGDIDDDGTIDVTLQSDGISHRMFDVAGSTSLTLNHLRLRDFTTSSLWGGIVIVNSGTASLDVQGCEMLSSHSGRNGGAIYCQAGAVTIEQSIFDSNSGDWGGAVTIYGGTTNIENSVFIDNNASLGGALYGRNGANINVRHCTFSGNTGTANGGAIYNLNQLTVENSLFVNNIVNSTVSNIRNDATFNDNGGNIYGGESETSNDPNDYFTDASNDDYTLNGRSLAADQGLNSLATNAGITTDLLGSPRPFVGTAQIVDAGAYELQADPDLVAPSISISTTAGNPTSDNPIPVTITFSESVSGFQESDLNVNGGTVDNFMGSADSYSFDLIPSADGTLTVDIAASVATDAVGNGNTAATQFS